MRFFVYFSAAFVWAIAVFGVMGWVLSIINPDRPNVSAGDMIATLATLCVAGILAFGGVILAEHAINRDG